MSRVAAMSSQRSSLPTYPTSRPSFPTNPVTISYTTVVRVESQQALDRCAPHVAATNGAEEPRQMGPDSKPRKRKRDLTPAEKEQHSRVERERRIELKACYEKLHAMLNGSKDMFSRSVILSQAINRLQAQAEEIAELSAQLGEGSAAPRPRRIKIEVKAEGPSLSPTPTAPSTSTERAAAQFSSLDIPQREDFSSDIALLSSAEWEAMISSYPSPANDRSPHPSALPASHVSNASAHLDSFGCTTPTAGPRV